MHATWPKKKSPTGTLWKKKWVYCKHFYHGRVIKRRGKYCVCWDQRGRKSQKTKGLGTCHARKSIKVLVAQSCPTLCNPVDCNPPSSSVRGILQTRILEWVAMSSSRSSQPRDQTRVSGVAHRFFTTSATWEAHKQDRHVKIVRNRRLEWAVLVLKSWILTFYHWTPLS